ncbi:MAG: RnfABCDGE type electron transport complex subunit D, partial [Verrucomicrobiota bacterium]
MKKILEFHDKIAPDFEKGGKLEKLYPLFEAQDTFTFTPADVCKGRTHLRDCLDIKRTMITVIFALFPCILFGIWNAGHQYNVVNGLTSNLGMDLLMGARWVLPVIMTSYVVGGIWEVTFAIIRKHEINEGFLVTGMLFPLTLPPTIPLWQVAVGITFGVVIGKEIFGGTGFNVLNPALTARAYLYFAHPGQISGDGVWTVIAKDGAVLEGFTGATPLAVAAAVPKGENVIAHLNDAGFTLQSLAFGSIGGSIGESSALACLIGAVILLLSGVGSWRIMLACIIGLFAGCSLMNDLDPERFIAYTQLPFSYHLVTGGFMFGVVYMA